MSQALFIQLKDAITGANVHVPVVPDALDEWPIDFSGGGDSAIVAAVVAKSTKIYRLSLQVDGDTVIQFKDGATVVDTYPLAANGQISLNLSSHPWLTGSINTDFKINSSNAVQVSGRLYSLTT